MLQIDKLLNVKIISEKNGNSFIDKYDTSHVMPIVDKPDIIFLTSQGVGADIIYVPECGDISDFFKSQKLNNISKTENIIIPPKMLIAGTTIITTKYQNYLKKAMPGFQLNKIVPKLKVNNKIRFFDTSSLVQSMVNSSNAKTISAVYNEFFEKVFLINNDFIKTELQKKQTEQKPILDKTISRDHQRLKIMLVDVDTTSSKIFNGFTANLQYYLQLKAYSIKDLKLNPSYYPDYIIYKIEKQYYPLAQFNNGSIQINKVVFHKIIDKIEDLKYEISKNTNQKDSKEDKSKEDKSEKNKINLLGFGSKKNINSILDIGKDLYTIKQKFEKDDSTTYVKKLKSYIDNNPLLDDLQGTNFTEKLENLRLATLHAEKINSKIDVKDLKDKDTLTNKLNEIALDTNSDDINLTNEDNAFINKLANDHEKLLKEHNGTIFTKDIQNRSTFPDMAFNPYNIVKLDEFSGYNKQASEFSSNLDEAMHDLFRSLLKDKDLGIQIHKIENKIKDDNNTRYKSYTVQISHPDYGQTYKKKYSFTVDVPYPSDEKYIKFGGNEYIIVNQLFNKPIQKINDQLVRLYTHYNTTSVTLKNSKLGIYNVNTIEKEFANGVKNLSPKLKTKMTTENMSTKTKDNLTFLDPSKRNIQFEKINITSPKFDIVFDLTNLQFNDLGVSKPFYELKLKNKTLLEATDLLKNNDTNETSEQAYFDIDKKIIKYWKGSDYRTFPLEHLDEFLLGMYNKFSTILTGQDLIKKNKSSVPYFNAKIIGKNIPVAILLVTQLGFLKAMEKMNLKWSIQDKKIINKDDNQLDSHFGGDAINIPVLIKGMRSYISIFPKTLKQRYNAVGLALTKYKIENVEFEQNSSTLYDDSLIKDLGLVGLSKLKESVTKIIDNTTEKILKESGYPTDVLDLYSDTIPSLLLNRQSTQFEDLDHYRIRMSEAISHIGYNQIQRAISELKKKKNFKDEKLYIKSNFIMSGLLEAGILQQSKTINPIEEMMLSQKIIKTGIGNVKKSQVTLARRDLNKSYFGVISPTATNEYGGIGSNQTLTNGTMINDRFGSIQTKAYNNNDNPFKMLAPVESLTTFYEYTDTTRRIMGNQQTGQFAQLENPDEPLVQTGFESYVPHLVSSRFTKKAKINGIISIKNDILTITGTGTDQGKIQKVPLRFTKSRTKRGTYLMNKYYLLVNDGQKITQGAILAATSSLKTGKIAIGKNLVVAEMGYNGYNYEDGWGISTEVKKKYENYYLQKVLILVPADVKITEMNLTKGKKTQSGDVLLSFIKKEHLESLKDVDQDELDDTTDDLFYGLEQHDGQSKYFSPGGEIEEIVVRLNSNKCDQKIKTLWNDSIKNLVELQSQCTIISEKSENKEQAYLECMGNTDNISSLKIGGHKILSEEPGWAIIEVYIKRLNEINNGSKFTLGNSGGKGTVQYVIPEKQEPISSITKLNVEFLATSLSIVKRKNTDIYFNLYLGKCIYFMNETMKELNKLNSPMSKISNFILNCISYIDKTEDKIIYKEYEAFFKWDENKVRKLISNSNSLSRPLIPAIKPPFMNRITMKDIVLLAKYIGIPLKEKLLIPENDDAPTMKKVPVGIMNVYMLEHFPQMQGSVRGSQYVKNSIITGQGSSGTKDRKGATKTGLYDLYSLLSKTPYNLIKEMHSLKSDAKNAKQNYQRQMLTTGRLPSIKNIKIEKQDTTTKNYLETLYLMAGIKVDY